MLLPFSHTHVHPWPAYVCTQPVECFQGVHGFSAPAGRCSSALMLRCTLASSGTSRSLHSSKQAAFAVVLMGLVHVTKVFHDMRRGTTPIYPLSRCLQSVAFRTTCYRSPDVRWGDSGEYSLLVFSASDTRWSFYRFHSVSRSVSLHGWSVPTPGKHTLQLSNIVLEQTTWVWLEWLPILRYLVCGLCCFVFRLSFWSSRYVLYTTAFVPVWRQDTQGGCSGVNSSRSSWCWAVCHIHDSAGGRGWLASLSDSRGAGLWGYSDRPSRAEVSVSSIGAKSVFCVVTARSSAHTKLRVPGWIGWSFVYTLKRSGARTLPCGRQFLCDRHLLLFPPSSTKNRRFSST